MALLLSAFGDGVSWPSDPGDAFPNDALQLMQSAGGRRINHKRDASWWES